MLIETPNNPTVLYYMQELNKYPIVTAKIKAKIGAMHGAEIKSPNDFLSHHERNNIYLKQFNDTMLMSKVQSTIFTLTTFQVQSLKKQLNYQFVMKSIRLRQ